MRPAKGSDPFFNGLLTMDPQRLFIVAAAVVQLALWLVFAGRYKRPAAAPGTTVLHYGWKLRLLGLTIAFVIPMLTIVFFATAPGRHASPLPIGITFLLCGCAGGALLLETQGVHLIVSSESVVSMSPWRRRLEWRWREIERVTWSRAHWSLVLHGPRQETIRASLFLVGIGELARAILRHVSGNKCIPARKMLDRSAK
jgi:hypothetical protein